MKCSDGDDRSAYLQMLNATRNDLRNRKRIAEKKINLLKLIKSLHNYEVLMKLLFIGKCPKEII